MDELGPSVFDETLEPSVLKNLNDPAVALLVISFPNTFDPEL
jgi:hypothetical protein